MQYIKNHINDETNQCLCKKCRWDRILNKTSDEEIAEKRRVKAIEIIKTWEDV